MLDFEAKMYQIRFRLGLRPRHTGGAYSAPSGPQLDVRALRGDEGRRRKGRKGERKGLYLAPNISLKSVPLFTVHNI